MMGSLSYTEQVEGTSTDSKDVVMVSGGGSGIGRATALRFASLGYQVAIVDVNEEAARAVAAEVEAYQGRALPIRCDVRNISEIVSAVQTIESHLGALAIQVNSAGIWMSQPFLEVSEGAWDAIMDVNAKGVFFCTQAAGRVMVTRGRGVIINISSIGGRGGRPFQPHYAASKAAVISITRSAAMAFRDHGVRVNAVCPGPIDTPMRQLAVAAAAELGGLAQFPGNLEQIVSSPSASPETIVSAITFLASDAASYINGQALNVCGGLQMD
jgi:NAD(P)-dependent dehydrogenase (short-subunit alcohol dehydrogenase family)